MREAERNLPPDSPHHEDLALYRRVLAQRRKDSDKVYSLHEPDVKCISKGKDHKKYEFGNKVSLTVTEKSGVIVGALSFSNPYDGHTLPAVIEQYESIFGRAPSEITVDRGYRGRTKIGQTTINIPKQGFLIKPFAESRTESNSGIGRQILQSEQPCFWV